MPKTHHRAPAAMHILTTLGALVVSCAQAQAGDISVEVGLDDLIARLGAIYPTGAGVVVGQVEAPEGGGYGPNQGLPEFIGKTFFAQSGPPGISGHATTVAQSYYGTAQSIAPGIATIYLYNANGWIQGNYLRVNFGAGVAPLVPPGGLKIFNNSWIGSLGTVALDNEALRRADFAVDRDDTLDINGVNNGGASQPLMSHMFDGISVGLTNGTHTSGPTLPSYDGPGRMKPEIVAPGDFTSFSAPVVSAAAALMVHTVDGTPFLAANPNAKKAEILKAVLLAGANHRTGWTNNPAASGPDRGLTTTPLDAVYGVDVVNVNRSHFILTGDEQNGSNTVPTQANATWRGWDLINVPFNSSRYYRFHVPEDADEVSILVTWNRNVPAGYTSWTLANFNLTLWRVDSNDQLQSLLGDGGLPYFGGGNVVSQSNVDNIEHVFVRNLEAGDYVLQLQRADGLGASWDAGVAWLFPQPPIAGDLNGDDVVDIDDLFQLLGAWGDCKGCPEDLDGNGAVDIDDLFTLLGNWS